METAKSMTAPNILIMLTPHPAKQDHTHKARGHCPVSMHHQHHQYQSVGVLFGCDAACNAALGKPRPVSLCPLGLVWRALSPINFLQVHTNTCTWENQNNLSEGLTLGSGYPAPAQQPRRLSVRAPPPLRFWQDNIPPIPTLSICRNYG